MPELGPDHGPQGHSVEKPERIGARRPTDSTTELQDLSGVEVGGTRERFATQQLLQVIFAIAQQRLDRRRSKHGLPTEGHSLRNEGGGGDFLVEGFDRVVFHGILQPLMRKYGMYYMLKDAGRQLVDFKAFATATTEQVKKASLAEAQRSNRPIEYLCSSGVDKQELARKILAKDPVEQGLICVFKVIEPCMTFEYHCSADRDQRDSSPLQASVCISTTTGSIPCSGS